MKTKNFKKYTIKKDKPASFSTSPLGQRKNQLIDKAKQVDRMRTCG